MNTSQLHIGQSRTWKATFLLPEMVAPQAHSTLYGIGGSKRARKPRQYFRAPLKKFIEVHSPRWISATAASGTGVRSRRDQL
jgi:hypothetical protein